MTDSTYNKGPLSNDPSPPQPSSGRPQPKSAIMLEVTLDQASLPNVVFKYSKIWDSPNFNGADPHKEFLKWVAGLIGNPIGGRSLIYDGAPGNRQPTKMSIKTKKLTYIVFRLDPAMNWRFSSDGMPISMDKYWNGRNVFYAGSHLDANGTEVGPAKNNSYKHAYFVVDAKNGKPPSPPTQEVEARFNLHVDFVEGSNNNDPYTPVIIDPDVRYPGGNG